jgi:hypothetical protein
MAGQIQAEDYDYAIAVVRTVCEFAGVPSYVDDLRADLRESGVIAAVARHDTQHLFNWLMSILSFQGISDEVAENFIHKHGNVTWGEVEQALRGRPSCPKLGGYWQFDNCRFHKTSGSCTQPDHSAACPLPRHPLRNGRLNQTAYSLFLFIRDIADGDLVDWIDRQIAAVQAERSQRPTLKARDALIGPLRNVYGISDKVIAMALSMLLIGAGPRKRQWFEIGASFVVVDTLVHNFLHRTGILDRVNAPHPYGPACYQPNGCCDVLGVIAAHIDASAFNRSYPQTFPRFVQSAVWRYCAENGLDVCNGNRIDDGAACDNVYCRLHRSCDRVALKPLNVENLAKNSAFSAA